MSTDEYVPSDEQVRTTFVEGASEDAYAMSWHEPYAEAYDRWLAAHDARVRRDALTALADHWDETVSEHAGRPLFSASGTHVRHYRDTHYPEETP